MFRDKRERDNNATTFKLDDDGSLLIADELMEGDVCASKVLNDLLDWAKKNKLAIYVTTLNEPSDAKKDTTLPRVLRWYSITKEASKEGATKKDELILRVSERQTEDQFKLGSTRMNVRIYVEHKEFMDNIKSFVENYGQIQGGNKEQKTTMPPPKTN